MRSIRKGWSGLPDAELIKTEGRTAALPPLIITINQNENKYKNDTIMKSLATYSNTQKARLLHELFPMEIPAFLEFATNLCHTIQEEEESNRSKWQNGIFTFDFWLQLIKQVEDNIGSSGKKLGNSSSHFAVQLFEGHIAFFSIYALRLYTTTRLHPNKQFTLAVELIFND